MKREIVWIASFAFVIAAITLLVSGLLQTVQAQSSPLGSFQDSLVLIADKDAPAFVGAVEGAIANNTDDATEAAIWSEVASIFGIDLSKKDEPDADRKRKAIEALEAVGVTNAATIINGAEFTERAQK